MKEHFALLLFPDKVHQRSPDPGPFTDHRSYKAALQKEFQRKCVYCRISDGLKGYEGFGVDHYHPKKGTDDPDLVAAWGNLFYACNVCNSWKGKRKPTPELYLPNPCAHPPSAGPMAEHLQYHDAEVETRTRHGAWLSELLHLSERRELREFVLSALGKFLAARVQALEILGALEERRKTVGSGAEAAGIARKLQDAQEKLAQANRGIERLTGEPVASVPHLS